MKLEVGIFIDSYDEVDGVVTVVNEYINHMSDKANFFVACPRPRTDAQKGKTNAEIVHCMGLHVPILNYDCGVPVLDRKFMRSMMQRKIDIIHAHSPFGVGHTGVKIAKAKGIPAVATLHSQYKKDFSRFLGKLLTPIGMSVIMRTFNNCDEVWAVNENTQRLLLEDYKCKNPRTTVMGNATSFLPLDGDFRSEVNAEYGLAESDKVLLFVGRLVPLKNVSFLPQVLQKLRERGQNFKLMLVGDGYYRKNIEKEVAKLGVGEDVVFCGTVNDCEKLRKIYQRADLFCFPSYYDTDGIVKFEAASQSTPTLFSEGALATGGIADGDNGFIAPNDVDRYADKITEIFQTPGLLQSVSQGANLRLYRTWGDIAEKAYNRYLELIEWKKQQLASTDK